MTGASMIEVPKQIRDLRVPVARQFAHPGDLRRQDDVRR